MARNIPENEDDFIRMQQEAIRRVRDMQERARRTLENAGMRIEPVRHEPRDSPHDDSPREDSPRVESRPASASAAQAGREARAVDPHQKNERPHPSSGFFAQPGRFQLSLDNEQILLLVLCFLLFQDGADVYLILALLYVLIP